MHLMFKLHWYSEYTMFEVNQYWNRWMGRKNHSIVYWIQNCTQINFTYKNVSNLVHATPFHLAYCYNVLSSGTFVIQYMYIIHVHFCIYCSCFFVCICGFVIVCDVWHSDDGVCKIVVPMFCFIVDSPASGNIILYTNQPCSFRPTVTSPAYEVYFST